MTGQAWATDDVVLGEGRHDVIQVRDASCDECGFSIPNGQHLAMGRWHTERDRGPGMPPTLSWRLECPNCGLLVRLAAAKQDEYDEKWRQAYEDHPGDGSTMKCDYCGEEKADVESVMARSSGLRTYQRERAFEERVRESLRQRGRTGAILPKLCQSCYALFKRNPKMGRSYRRLWA